MADGTMNPWLTIWTRPRETIRSIVDTDPARSVIWLSMAGGALEALDRASSKNLGDTMGLPSIFLMALAIGLVGGPVGLYIGGAVLRWSGGLLGGQGQSQEVRAALAWANVPVIWAAVLWVPELLIMGKEAFTKQTPALDANAGLLAAITVLGIAKLVVGIWAIVVLLKCLGEVHRFSAWRALGSALIPFALIAGVILLVVFLLQFAK